MCQERWESEKMEACETQVAAKFFTPCKKASRTATDHIGFQEVSQRFGAAFLL